MIDLNLEKIGIYKGVPFRYLDAGQGTGTELEITKYVGGVYYDVTEKSSGPDPIRVNAVFIGEAAEAEHLLFMELAVKKPGPGLLIHPNFGAVMAYLRARDWETDGRAQGRISMPLEFLPILSVPGSQIAYVAAVAAKAIAMRAAAFAEVASAYCPPGSALESQIAADTVTAAGSLADLPGLSDEAGASVKAALDLAAAIPLAGLAEYWQGVAESMDSAEAVAAAVDIVTEGWSAARAAMAAGYDYVRDSNTAAQYEAIAGAFGARLAVLTIQGAYECLEDAQAAGTGTYERLRGLMELASSPALISTIADLAGLLYQGIVEESLKLPRRVTFEVDRPMSALELAYLAYGDYTRADEIVDDNSIGDPGLMEFGVVKVLSE